MPITEEQLEKVRRINSILNGPDLELPELCTDGGEHSFTFLTHADSREAYMWVHECKKCNGIIKTTNQRTGEDAAYWQ